MLRHAIDVHIMKLKFILLVSTHICIFSIGFILAKPSISGEKSLADNKKQTSSNHTQRVSEDGVAKKKQSATRTNNTPQVFANKQVMERHIELLEDQLESMDHTLSLLPPVLTADGSLSQEFIRLLELTEEEVTGVNVSLKENQTELTHKMLLQAKSTPENPDFPTKNFELGDISDLQIEQKEALQASLGEIITQDKAHYLIDNIAQNSSSLISNQRGNASINFGRNTNNVVVMEVIVENETSVTANNLGFKEEKELPEHLQPLTRLVDLNSLNTIQY